MKAGKIITGLLLIAALILFGCESKDTASIEKSTETEMSKATETMPMDSQQKTSEMASEMEDVAAKGSTDVFEQMSKTALETMDFTLKDHAGREIKLSDFKGKPIVLEWFNYDCPFDKFHYEDQTMQNLANKWMDQGVVWMAINSTNYATEANNRAWAEKYNLNYPILDDSSGRVGRLFGATNTPHMYIIDQKGSIVYSGAIDNAPMGKIKDGAEMINYVDNALMELMADKPISTRQTTAYGCSVKYAK